MLRVAFCNFCERASKQHLHACALTWTFCHLAQRLLPCKHGFIDLFIINAWGLEQASEWHTNVLCTCSADINHWTSPAARTLDLLLIIICNYQPSFFVFNLYRSQIYLPARCRKKPSLLFSVLTKNCLFVYDHACCLFIHSNTCKM